MDSSILASPVNSWGGGGETNRDTLKTDPAIRLEAPRVSWLHIHLRFEGVFYWGSFGWKKPDLLMLVVIM